MEIFSHTHATSNGRTYADSDEAYLQESLEPPYRLTNRELQQIREIRKEIESRPKLTRFEARYIRVLKVAEQDYSGTTRNCSDGISRIREILKEAARTNSCERRSISISLLIAVFASSAGQRTFETF